MISVFVALIGLGAATYGLFSARHGGGGTTASGERSVAVGGDNAGIVSTAPHATNVQHRTVLPEEALRPVTEVAAPPGLMNVPVHDGVFVGRRDDLAAIDAALAGGADAPLVVAAVHGLGGVGKSTLAARYAATRADAGRPVWWITADGPAGVRAGLAALAAALQPELAQALPSEALAERATAWLSAHPGWLLVLDNVNDPADVAPLLGRRLAGQIMITSRLGEGWHRFGAGLLRLDVLTERQAAELLLRIADHLDADTPQLAELCEVLGRLPLAVEQAAVFLRRTRLTPVRYLELLRHDPAVMYERTARKSDAERTIARIWRITLDTLADTPLAGELLRIMAWWAPEAVPRLLLEPAADAVEVATALGELAAYNMITLDAAADTVIVHRLVQAVARTPDHRDPHRRAADVERAHRQAAALLHGACPPNVNDPELWPIWRALFPHIDALLDHAPPEKDTIPLALLLSWGAGYLWSQGDAQRAIAYLERGLAADRRLRGELHSDTLRSVGNLAAVYEAVGEPERAFLLHEAALAERERVLGGDHPDTLALRNNLAIAYSRAGDLERAIPLSEQVLADCLRVLGADHDNTLSSRNNLAAAHKAAGDLERAIPLHEAALAERERVLGSDHPDTLVSRNNLVAAYRAAGDRQRAMELCEANVADCRRVLGDDHPFTKGLREDLGTM
ncbi:tetratricopeptide repeat protein [Spirillospora sp. NPDC050679]